MKKFSVILIFILFVNSASAQLNWTRVSNGMTNYNTMSFTSINQGSNTILYAGTDKGGVYRSVDLGNNWTATPSHTTFPNTATWAMTSVDTFVFAGQRFGGVLRSTLNGNNWVWVNNGLSNKAVQDIMTIGSTIYVATYGGGVFFSSNLGNSWTQLYSNAGLDDLLGYSLAHNSSDLYFGSAGRSTTMPDTGVAWISSIIGGNSWQKINNGFIKNGAHFEQVFSMDANDSLVFAGTDDVGIFRSVNQSNNWKRVDSLTGDVHAIKIAGQWVYYGTSYGGVHTSQNNGHTFAANNSGLSFGPTTIPYLVKDFIVIGSEIFAATDIGVFKQNLPSIATNITTKQRISPEFSFYPVPSGEILFIRSNEKQIVQIRTLIGTIVKQFEVDAGLSELNVGELDNGLYFLSPNDGIPPFKLLQIQR